MRRTMLVAVLGLVGAMLGFQVSSAQAATTVRGTYVSFGAGAVLTGGFTGLTAATAEAEVDEQGNVSGTFDEWFYGRQTADPFRTDNAQGGLHYTGTFSITAATAEFLAQGTIVGGTCGFAGSRGTIVFEGNVVTGNYTANWVRPSPLPPPDPTCMPVDLG